MKKAKFPTDRKILSTDNNGYAEGMRDETLWEQDAIDTEIPLDDYLPEVTDENGEADREVYNEDGFTNIQR